MRIAFSRVGASQKTPFELQKEGLTFKGTLILSQNLVLCEGSLKGAMAHSCDLCGEDISVDLNEPIRLNISHGAYKDIEGELSDTVEFFTDYIDLDELIESEIQNIKSDYFYCDSCKSKRS